MKKIILLSLCILSFAFAKEISQFDKALNAYNQKDFKTAFKLWEDLALDQNNKSSTKNIADMYIDGEGVTRNVDKGIYFYKKHTLLVTQKWQTSWVLYIKKAILLRKM